MTGPTSEPRTRVRSAVTAAAVELFTQQGYDATTVDAIAARAGVSRRTFFRHFATKDDAVLPDHEAMLARVREVLDGWDGDPLAVLLPAARVVLGTYLADPDAALARHVVLRQVPELRERERAVVTRYQRAFASFLRHRWTGGPAGLGADVLAAAVVAAHNAVLRQWLRDPGSVDADARLADAVDWVVRSLTVSDDGAGPSPEAAVRALHRIRSEVDRALG